MYNGVIADGGADMSYSRIPSLVFAAHGKESDIALQLPPMHSRQPVRYHQVRTLLQSTDGSLPTGSILPVVDMDWRTGRVVVYEDEDDALNGIVCVQSSFRCWCKPRECDEYADEIETLMDRGHSLTEPLCDCLHNLSAERALELGIQFKRRGHCQISVVAEHTITWNCETIAQVIGIEDLHTFICADGLQLMKVLNFRSTMEGLRMHCVENDKIIFSSANSTLYIDCPEKLVKIADKAWPRSVILPTSDVSYAGIQRDSQMLASRGEIRLISGKEGTMCVFAMGPSKQKKVDEDIRAMWHGH